MTGNGSLAANPILVQNRLQKEIDPKQSFLLATNDAYAYPGGQYLNGEPGDNLKKSSLGRLEPVLEGSSSVGSGLNVGFLASQNGGRDLNNLDDNPLSGQLSNQLNGQLNGQLAGQSSSQFSQFGSQFDGQPVLLASSLSSSLSNSISSSISNSFSSSFSNSISNSLSSSLSNYNPGQIVHYPTNGYPPSSSQLTDGQFAYNSTLFDQFQRNMSTWTGLNSLNGLSSVTGLDTNLGNLKGSLGLNGSRCTALNSAAFQSPLVNQDPPSHQHFLNYPLGLNAYNHQ